VQRDIDGLGAEKPLNRKISRRRFLQTVGLSGAGMVGLSSYAFAIEPNWRLVVKHRPITPPNWPRDLNLKIAVIADLHAGGPSMPLERIEAIVDTTNALAPDLTVLLGDFAASYKFRTRKVAPEEWSAALGKLRAPYGVHAVLGNHDWWDDLAAQRNRKGPVIGRRMLEKQHIPVYENHAVRLRKDGEPFWIAGLGDQLAFFMGRKRGRRVFRGVDDLDGTLAKVHDHAPVILLAHEPDVFPRVTDPRVAVTLSGHTHGGQVRLFGYSPMVPSRYGNRFAYGKIVEQGRHLVVSGGLGCSILPVRLGCPPEILLVELAGANVAAAIPNVAVAA
jgi:uncharacterized protein